MRMTSRLRPARFLYVRSGSPTTPGVQMTTNDPDDIEDQADGTKTGAGTEAVQGTPESSIGSPGVAHDKPAPGASRDRQHESGYGGRGGESKSSSENREPNRPD